MLPVCQKKLGFSFRSSALILPFRKDGTDLGWNLSMHLKQHHCPVTHDQSFLRNNIWLWPSIAWASILWVRGFAQKGSNSTILCLGHFVREFPAGSSSHRHACHHCLNIKKKYIFPFLNLSLFLSLSFPDHLMLDGQSSCLSFHLPKQSLASQAMTGAVAVVMDDCVSSGRVGRS